MAAPISMDPPILLCVAVCCSDDEFGMKRCVCVSYLYIQIWKCMTEIKRIWERQRWLITWQSHHLSVILSCSPSSTISMNITTVMETNDFTSFCFLSDEWTVVRGLTFRCCHMGYLFYCVLLLQTLTWEWYTLYKIIRFQWDKLSNALCCSTDFAFYLLRESSCGVTISAYNKLKNEIQFCNSNMIHNEWS